MALYLLLAHILGDFVLQTDWMVRKRDDLRVLTLHAGIHFTLMFLLVGISRSVIWPYLLLLALSHLVQDRIKNSITNTRPDWTRIAFIIDQAIHLTAIWALVWWIERAIGPLPLPGKPAWVLIVITLLFVTFVWFVIERLFNLSNADYLENINNTKYSRMLTRVGMVSLFLIIQAWTTSGFALLLTNPYAHKKFRQRALLTDIGISLFAIIFLSWALG
jgi:hypothetical protein